MKTKDVASNVGMVLIAAAAGAGIALLWAPQSGDKTRRQIRHKAEDALAELRGVYDAIKEAGGDARRNVYRLRTRLTELYPAGRSSN